MSTLDFIAGLTFGVKAVEDTAPATERQLSKAGVALSADARAKLQALADWLESEQDDTLDPNRHVQHGSYGAVCTIKDWADPRIYVTYVSTMGALVQMYEPFKLSEATQLTHSMWRAPSDQVIARIGRILGISVNEVTRLWIYLLKDGGYLHRIIDNLRTLK